MAATGFNQVRPRSFLLCVMDCFMFYHRKNMCKAEGAEFYITAADRHWKTDGELRAVAEVPF